MDTNMTVCVCVSVIHVKLVDPQQIKTVIRRLFSQPNLMTQFSVTITHNSKMVGPIAKRLFGQTITLFP